MLKPLAQVLSETRQAANVTQIAVALAAGCSQAVVSRFEHADYWPQIGPDRLVSAYAEECGIDWRELWKQALDLTLIDG